MNQTRLKRSLGAMAAGSKRHLKHRHSPREELDEFYRNRPVGWDEAKDGAFWGYRGRRGARM